MGVPILLILIKTCLAVSVNINIGDGVTSFEADSFDTGTVFSFLYYEDEPALFFYGETCHIVPAPATRAQALLLPQSASNRYGAKVIESCESENLTQWIEATDAELAKLRSRVIATYDNFDRCEHMGAMGEALYCPTRSGITACFLNRPAGETWRLFDYATAGSLPTRWRNRGPGITLCTYTGWRQREVVRWNAPVVCHASMGDVFTVLPLSSG